MQYHNPVTVGILDISIRSKLIQCGSLPVAAGAAGVPTISPAGRLNMGTLASSALWEVCPCTPPTLRKMNELGLAYYMTAV